MPGGLAVVGDPNGCSGCCVLPTGHPAAKRLSDPSQTERSAFSGSMVGLGEVAQRACEEADSAFRRVNLGFSQSPSSRVRAMSFSGGPLLTEAEAFLDERTEVFLDAARRCVSPNWPDVEVHFVPARQSVDAIGLSVNFDGDLAHATRAYAPQNPGIDRQWPVRKSGLADRLRLIVFD